jgi:PAS domain S-box-containing protein
MNVRGPEGSRRGRAARELAAPELADVLESGAIGIFTLASDGTIAWANSAEYEPLGYRADEYVGRSVFDFHVDRPALESVLTRLRQGEVVRDYEATLQCRNGARKRALVSASPQFDEQGRFVRARCFSQLLPERGAGTRESGIRASNPESMPPGLDLHAYSPLQTIADAVPVLVSYVGLDLRYRFVNKAYQGWFGVAREEVVGRSLVETLGPIAFEAVRPHAERALRGEAVTFEAVLPYRTAGARFIRASYVPHQGATGEIEGFVALVSDVSDERKAASEREELLRVEQVARERLATLAKASDVLAQSLDYERTLQSVTDLVLPLLGDFGFFDIREGDEVRRIARAHQSPELEATLQGSGFDANACPDDLCALATGSASLHPNIDLAWMRRAARSPEQLEHLQKLGFRSMISVPLTYQGEALGALTLFFAGSGRRHTSSDLTLAEELARRAAAAVINARLFKEARDAIGVRDDFLSMAGHELRTPLTALQLQILSITKMIGQADGAEKIATRAEKAGRNVLRLSSLVNELLDISRISAGRLRLERGQVDLAEAVRDVLLRHKDELAKNGCELQFTASEGVIGCWDRVRVEQIATNLLTNAIKYGKGKPIEVRVTRDEGTAKLIVADHGIGISPEDQQRIFQRFERAVSSRHFGGLGLGLWIARQLVDAHGGSIHVHSVEDQGATFELELPVNIPDEVHA